MIVSLDHVSVLVDVGDLEHVGLDSAVVAGAHGLLDHEDVAGRSGGRDLENRTLIEWPENPSRSHIYFDSFRLVLTRRRDLIPVIARLVGDIQ